ncbi:glutathione S-transferase N-terminal domain-containing protein [Pelagibacteraceae bacterium]|nr:glutathione S-transferase N-terminal domain-containing protein [Pelagibacteraceae bacterium]
MLNNNYPILYSFRRCPFAIRARAAIYLSEIKVEIREVLLTNKPKEMTTISPKGTVPILHDNENIIDESFDIIIWALNICDKNNILLPYKDVKKLINSFDVDYKFHLDRYKYDNRYVDEKEYLGKLNHRKKALKYLEQLDAILLNNKSYFLYKDSISILDISIFPLVRQFKIADPIWFNDLELDALKRWLDSLINSIFFKKVMYKYSVWKNTNDKEYFHNLI